MKANVNHPTFLAFLENVTNTILSNVNVENYFKISQDKKMNVLYMVFKLMKKSVENGPRLSDMEMRSFITVLWKRNEELENYEFAAVLNDISNNFDSICEVTKAPKRTRTIKVDKKQNGEKE